MCLQNRTVFLSVHDKKKKADVYFGRLADVPLKTAHLIIVPFPDKLTELEPASCQKAVLDVTFVILVEKKK